MAAVVADNGSGTCNTEFAGDDAPRGGKSKRKRKRKRKRGKRREGRRNERKERREERGEERLATLGYADDILVFSENKDDLVKMLEEPIDSFKRVGLDISVEKCAWSSFPPEKQGTLNVGGFN